MSKNGIKHPRRVWYPYYRFAIECEVPTLFGRKRVSMTCLVDGINDIAATADPDSRAVRSEPVDDRLAPKITPGMALRTAKRYMFHHLARHSRSIANFDTSVKPCGIYYREFRIADGGEHDLLVDCLTGSVYPLDRRCA